MSLRPSVFWLFLVADLEVSRNFCFISLLLELLAKLFPPLSVRNAFASAYYIFVLLYYFLIPIVVCLLSYFPVMPLLARSYFFATVKITSMIMRHYGTCRYLIYAYEKDVAYIALLLHKGEKLLLIVHYVFLLLIVDLSVIVSLDVVSKPPGLH